MVRKVSPNYEREKAENESLKLQLQQFWKVIYQTEMELANTREKAKSYRIRTHKLERRNQELTRELKNLKKKVQQTKY